MATLVLTVIGDDRSGLVSALSGVVTDHGGSWERSHLARLAGKFAGIVVVAVPDDRVQEFTEHLTPLQSQGLLEVRAERGDDSAAGGDAVRLSLSLVGADRPGIVHAISRALAASDVGIEELQTDTREAPMAGGVLFEATATLLAPPGRSVDDVRLLLEGIADELMVDLALSAD
jgi:glycine cleavage system regulatory protein